MVIKLLFELIIMLLEVLFGWVSFPAMPAEITTALGDMLYYMGEAMAIVWLIVPRDLVIVGLPVILVLENFDKLYSVIMWILKKIPALGIS